MNHSFSTDDRRRNIVFVIVASMAFATSGPLGKVSSGISPISVAAARTGLAAVVLAFMAQGALWRAVRTLTRDQRLRVFGAGALLGAHFALFLGGLGATSLAAAVALVSLEPIAVVLAAFLAFRIRPKRRELLGLAVATAGAAIVASAAGIGQHRLAGDLMVLGAVVLFGAYVASARGLRDAMPATPYATAVYGVASVVLLPVALVTTHGHPTGGATPQGLAAVLGLALVPTLIGHTLVQRAARDAPPVLVALVCPGETIGGIAIGAVAIGALPTAREVFGALVIVIGAMLAVTARAE